MTKKKAASQKVKTKLKNYERGSYKKKQQVKVTSGDAWKMARRVSEFAYIFQKISENPNATENKNITKSLSMIKPILQQAYKNWEEEFSWVWQVESVKELENIFVGIHNNSIFEEKSEEDVLTRIWQLISYGDITPHELYEKNPITVEQIRKSIAENNKGPKDAAYRFWDKISGHGSATQVRKYMKDYKSGALPDPMIQRGTTFFERKQFIAEVCGRLLELNTEELQWMNEGIMGILKDRENN